MEKTFELMGAIPLTKNHEVAYFKDLRGVEYNYLRIAIVTFKCFYERSISQTYIIVYMHITVENLWADPEAFFI